MPTEFGKLLSAIYSIGNFARCMNPRQGLQIDIREYEEIYRQVVLVCAESKPLALQLTSKSSDFLKDVFDRYADRTSAPGAVRFTQPNCHAIIKSGADLSDRAIEELSDRIFFLVAPAKVEFFASGEVVFGPAVFAKFPDQNTDMTEAGKCFALDRHTACVFHLMRIVEAGVKAFGGKLGIPLANDMMWQPILDALNPIIRRLNTRDPLTIQYAAIQAHLYAVKVAWRNEVMHPKANYDESEAREIFQNVRTFLSELVKVL